MSEALKRACGVGLISVAGAFGGCTCSSADDWAQTSPVIKAEAQAETANSQTVLNLHADDPVAQQ